MNKSSSANRSLYTVMLRKGKSHVAKEKSGRGRRRRSREKGNQGVGHFRFITITIFFIFFFNYFTYSFFSLLFLPTTFTHTHTHTYDPRPLPTTHDPRHLDTLGASLTRAQFCYKVLRGFGIVFKAFNPFWRPLLLHFVLNG